jgi:hypothetical protein
MKKNQDFLYRFALLFIMVLATGPLMAQDTLNWTGAVSTDGSDPANWEPQVALTGNRLFIDSAYKFTNMPVFSGSDSIDVNMLVIHPTGVMTINFDDSLTLFNVATEYFEPHGTIHINRGTLQGRRVHIEDTNTVINVNSGGLLVARKYLFMSGDGNNRPYAGYLNISGTGKVIYTAEQASGGFNRFPTDTTTGVITINPFGTLDLKGSFADYCNTLVGKNQIMAPDGYNVVVEYDAGNDWTYVFVQSATLFIIEPTTALRLIEDDTGDTIKVVKNEGYDEMASFEWKYTTTSGSGYVAFSPAQTQDIILPVFTEPGHYYLVCEGTKTAGGTRVTNEVEIFVASSKVLVTPGADQSLRADLNGAMLTVTKDASITGVEWKWSATLGSDYVSFSPVQTGVEYTPNFDTNGLYWVVCEGTDGSNTYMSKDVMILVGDAAFNIYWNGSVSNSARDVVNWDPLANVDGNIVNVGAPDTYEDSLVFSGPGNLNINKFNISDTLTTMTVDMGEDTLRVSNMTYVISGELIIMSGVFNYRDLRLEPATGRVIIKGGELLIRSSYFMMGNKNLNSGGHLDIMGDGKLISLEQQPARFSNDTTQSVIFITEDAMMQVPGDWRGGAETAIAKRQLITTELEELIVDFPVVIGEDSVTQVTAKSLLIFDISPLDDQLVGVGESVSEIACINDDEITTYEWQYATTSGGPYTAFDPAQTGNTFTGSFAAAGEYYVICVGDGTETSAEVKIQVVGVVIDPAADQEILEAEAGTPLTVTESIVADSREWKSSTTSGSGYTPVVPPQSGTSYTPLFLTEGTYYVVCSSTFGTKTLNSNEVKVIVSKDTESVKDLKNSGISVYPNPAQEYFLLNAGKYRTYNVKISNMSGQVIWEYDYDNASGPQKITPGHKGLYLVQIRTVDGVYTTTLMME